MNNAWCAPAGVHREPPVGAGSRGDGGVAPRRPAPGRDALCRTGPARSNGCLRAAAAGPTDRAGHTASRAQTTHRPRQSRIGHRDRTLDGSCCRPRWSQPSTQSLPLSPVNPCWAQGPHTGRELLPSPLVPAEHTVPASVTGNPGLGRYTAANYPARRGHYAAPVKGQTAPLQHGKTMKRRNPTQTASALDPSSSSLAKPCKK